MRRIGCKQGDKAIIGHKTCQVFQDVVVVSQNNKQLLAEVEASNARAIINTQASLGLSESIKTAVKATQPDIAWMFILADMPFVKISTLQALASEACRECICQPRSNKEQAKPRLGNPVVIGVDFRDALLQLTGDVGAKNVVQANSDKLNIVDVEDLGIYQDIDQPSDLKLDQN